MSLRSVHILFIVLATALAVMFGVWSLRNYSTLVAIASFAVGVILAVYGIWFVSKTKDVSEE